MNEECNPTNPAVLFYCLSIQYVLYLRQFMDDQLNSRVSDMQRP